MGLGCTDARATSSLSCRSLLIVLLPDRSADCCSSVFFGFPAGVQGTTRDGGGSGSRKEQPWKAEAVPNESCESIDAASACRRRSRRCARAMGRAAALRRALEAGSRETRNCRNISTLPPSGVQRMAREPRAVGGGGAARSGRRKQRGSARLSGQGAAGAGFLLPAQGRRAQRVHTFLFERSTYHIFSIYTYDTL